MFDFLFAPDIPVTGESEGEGEDVTSRIIIIIPVLIDVAV